MVHEMDSRRAQLEARRYHVKVEIAYGDGTARSGEFFYDSLSAARRFIRKQYVDWCWSNDGLGLEVTPADWKTIWKRGALQVTIEKNDGCDRSFLAVVRDTAVKMEGPQEVYQVDYDLVDNSQFGYEVDDSEEEV